LCSGWIKPWRSHEIHGWMNLESPGIRNLKTGLEENTNQIKHKFGTRQVMISLFWASLIVLSTVSTPISVS